MEPAADPDDVTWITDNVAITNFFSSRSKETLADHKVGAILCLDRDLVGEPAVVRGVEKIVVVNMVDGPNEMSVFRQAVSALEALVEGCGRVVVHCRAGRSRSIAVVAAYLKKTPGLESADAIAFVKAKREAAIAPELLRLVEQFEP